MIIVGLALGLIFLVLSMLRPVWAYGLILALLPTYAFRFEVLNIPTTGLELLVGVFLLGVLVSHWNIESWYKIKSLGSTNWLVGLFVLAGIISVIVSPETTRAVGLLKAYILEPVLFFYASVVIFKNQQEFKPALKLLFITAVILSVFGLIQYYTHILLPLRFWGYGEEIKRITSIFEYPNAFALYLTPLFLFFTTLNTKSWLFKSTLWPLIGLVAMAGASVITYSRGAWLAIVCGLIVLALQQSKISLKRWVIIGALITIALVPVIGGRIKQTFHDASSTERLSLVKTAINKVSDNPIFGNGLYGFRTTLENSNYNGEILNYPHNIILNFWLEMGLLGLIVFVSLVVKAVIKYKETPSPLGLAICIAVLVMLVHGLVDVPYFKNDLALLFWFMMSGLFVKP